MLVDARAMFRVRVAHVYTDNVFQAKIRVELPHHLASTIFGRQVVQARVDVTQVEAELQPVCILDKPVYRLQIGQRRANHTTILMSLWISKTHEYTCSRTIASRTNVMLGVMLCNELMLAATLARASVRVSLSASLYPGLGFIRTCTSTTTATHCTMRYFSPRRLAKLASCIRLRNPCWPLTESGLSNQQRRRETAGLTHLRAKLLVSAA